MLAYPASRRFQHQHRQQPSYEELEAMADDLEYQAARARDAARRQQSLASYEPYRPHTYESSPLPRRSAPTARYPTSAEYSRPPRHSYHPYYDEYDEEYAPAPASYGPSPRRHYTPTPVPLHRPHRRPRSLDFFDSLVEEEPDYYEVSEEQRRRESREARVLAAAERARVRAQAEAEAHRARAQAEAEALRARVAAEVEAARVEKARQVAFARLFLEQQQKEAREKEIRERLLRQKAEKERAPQAQAARTRALGQAQQQQQLEAAFAQLLSLGGRPQSVAEQPQPKAQAPPKPEAPESTPSGFSLEDFLAQLLGMAAIARPESQPTGQPQPQPTLAIPNTGFNQQSAVPTASVTQQSAQPTPQSRVPSPSLPTPGARTFSHLTPNRRDPGLTPQEVQARAGPDEVADIMEAIKRSLDPGHNVTVVLTPKAAPATSTASSASAPGATPTQPKAESKPKPVPTPKTHIDPISHIEDVEARFVNLKYDFVFPSNPDFPIKHTSPTTFTPALLFTPTNQPIRTHEHALTNLLTELDSIDSEGKEDVRMKRKELVVRIEEELVRLEEQKMEAWRRVSEGKQVETESAPAPQLELSGEVEVEEPVSTAVEVESSTATEPEGYIILDPTEKVESPQADDATDAPATATDDVASGPVTATDGEVGVSTSNVELSATPSQPINVNASSGRAPTDTSDPDLPVVPASDEPTPAELLSDALVDQDLASSIMVGPADTEVGVVSEEQVEDVDSIQPGAVDEQEQDGDEGSHFSFEDDVAF